MHGQRVPLQFILCCGDDSSDELMFSALHSKFGQRPADLDLFTVTVGRKPSEASSYLTDHTDVVELLKMVGSMHANKQKRLGGAAGGSVSLNDMSTLDDALGMGSGRDAVLARKVGIRATDSLNEGRFRRATMGS